MACGAKWHRPCGLFGVFLAILVALYACIHTRGRVHVVNLAVVAETPSSSFLEQTNSSVPIVADSCEPCDNSGPSYRRLLQVIGQPPRAQRKKTPKRPQDATGEVCAPCPRKAQRTSTPIAAPGALTPPVVPAAGGAASGDAPSVSTTQLVSFGILAQHDTDSWQWLTGSAALSLQGAHAIASAIGPYATTSVRVYGVDGSGAIMQAHVKAEIVKAVMFGANLVEAPPFEAARAVSGEISLLALSKRTPHMVTAGVGSSFTLPQVLTLTLTLTPTLTRTPTLTLALRCARSAPRGPRRPRRHARPCRHMRSSSSKRRPLPPRRAAPPQKPSSTTAVP